MQNSRICTENAYTAIEVRNIQSVQISEKVLKEYHRCAKKSRERAKNTQKTCKKRAMVKMNKML